ncbi:MAG: hypothetical protein ABI602_00150 [Candidatus Saccharibacteria bacterium]
MKILILEGIATSGKSTVISGIRKRLAGLSVEIARESETHIPIMKQTDELHIQFFEELITLLATDKPDLLIFDRLYLTQAFRAKVSLEQYSQIENILNKQDALTAFLKIDDAAIADRVSKAAEHRDASWREYIKTKGDTTEQVADYYITQQQNQLKLLETSMLPHIICDTTTHNYDEVIQRIVGKLKLV